VIKINDNTILKATELFTKYAGGDIVYMDCVNCINKIEDLTKIKDEEVIKIIDFLVEWKCRGLVGSSSLDIQKMSRQLEDMKKTLRSLNNEFKKLKLKGYTLKDVPLENENIKKTILTIYKDIDSIKQIGPTAASKIMHIINPRLFIMWDEAIRSDKRGYGYGRGTADQYVEFMKKMQSIAITLKTNWEEKEIEIVIKKRRTLTKLMDEVNYMGITRNIKIE